MSLFYVLFRNPFLLEILLKSAVALLLFLITDIAAGITQIIDIVITLDIGDRLLHCFFRIFVLTQFLTKLVLGPVLLF